MTAATITITDVRAREILDCRGLPTVQVDVVLDGGVVGRADVPAGRSTGRHEARERRDGGTRYGGFGVRSAVGSVTDEIRPALLGRPAVPQRAVDQALIALDGTPDKARLGANAIAGVSLATARAAAAAHGAPLYRHLNADAHVLPVPQVNLINGGRHASNDLDFQEFIIMPVGASSFAEALAMASETNLALRDLVVSRYGKLAANVGDEGGYAAPASGPEEALELLHRATEQAGCAERVVYGLDCAASHLYDEGSATYTVAGKRYDGDALAELYARLVDGYGVVSIEDPLHEDDLDGLAALTARLGIQLVGDDAFVTSAERVARAAALGAGNALLWKFNQVGTLSEALDAATTALRNRYAVVVSERSGETEDPLIADLTVALGAGQIKTGAPVRSERVAKYNRLLQIEEELGGTAVYAGRDYRSAV